MDAWAGFEKRVRLELDLAGLTVIQVPSVERTVRGKRFRKKTEFDFCVGIKGIAAFFDAKNFDTNQRLNISTYILHPKKIHQYNNLWEAFDRGNIAGYLVHFGTKEVITWVPISVVQRCIKSGVKSIGPDTIGVVSQRDDRPINLVILVEEEMRSLIGSLQNAKR